MVVKIKLLFRDGTSMILDYLSGDNYREMQRRGDMKNDYFNIIGAEFLEEQ